MSLQDELLADLENVFYSDFSTEALIHGQSVTGYLTRADSSFGLDAESYVFDAPAVHLKNVRRGDPVEIDGVIYQVIRPDFNGDRTYLVLAI